jgi:hypothetical protein
MANVAISMETGFAARFAAMEAEAAKQRAEVARLLAASAVLEAKVSSLEAAQAGNAVSSAVEALEAALTEKKADIDGRLDALEAAVTLIRSQVASLTAPAPGGAVAVPGSPPRPAAATGAAAISGPGAAVSLSPPPAAPFSASAAAPVIVAATDEAAAAAAAAAEGWPHNNIARLPPELKAHPLITSLNRPRPVPPLVSSTSVDSHPLCLEELRILRQKYLTLEAEVGVVRSQARPQHLLYNINRTRYRGISCSNWL